MNNIKHALEIYKHFHSKEDKNSAEPPSSRCSSCPFHEHGLDGNLKAILKTAIKSYFFCHRGQTGAQRIQPRLH
jgi:CRISPR/Cas system-associated exonuclease Cas4 (RecB family)